jgi:hypothetical protein
VRFPIWIRSQSIGKDSHKNQEQYDNPAGSTQWLLLDQPGKEIRKPAPRIIHT